MSRTPYLLGASVASLVAGAAIGATLLVPSAVNAQTGSSDTTTPTTEAPAPTPPKNSWVDDALKPLVDAGTITQAQADAVKDALSKAKPAFPGDRRERPPFGGPIGKNPTKVADALGMTVADLKAGLASGKTLAELATEHGKDPAAVVQIIIDDLNARIDAAVTAGKLTQAQADQIKADEKARAEDMVNGKLPLGPGRRHPGGFGGPGEFPPPPAPAAPVTVTD